MVLRSPTRRGPPGRHPFGLSTPPLEVVDPARWAQPRADRPRIGTQFFLVGAWERPDLICVEHVTSHRVDADLEALAGVRPPPHRTSRPPRSDSGRWLACRRGDLKPPPPHKRTGPSRCKGRTDGSDHGPREDAPVRISVGGSGEIPQRIATLSLAARCAQKHVVSYDKVRPNKI